MMNNQDRYNRAMDKFEEVVDLAGKLHSSLEDLEGLIGEPTFHYLFHGPATLDELKELVEWEANPNGEYERNGRSGIDDYRDQLLPILQDWVDDNTDGADPSFLEVDGEYVTLAISAGMTRDDVAAYLGEEAAEKIFGGGS